MAIVTSCLKEHAEVGLIVDLTAELGCRGAGILPQNSHPNMAWY